MNHPTKTEHASPSGKALPDSVSPPCPEKARSIELSDAAFIIQVAEAILAPVDLPDGRNPYIPEGLNPHDCLFEEFATYFPPSESYSYSELASDLYETDEAAAAGDPDFKQKAVLSGVRTVLDFCQRELLEKRNRHTNLLFHQAIQEAVRKSLVRLLAEWYTLEEGGRIG